MSIEQFHLSGKAQLRYEDILKHQDWIKTDLDKLAVKLSSKINIDDNVGLLDYYPVTIFAKYLMESYVSEVTRLRKGISEIIEVVEPPCAGISSYQALAMSPTKLIEHCNSLLSIDGL